MPSLYTITIPVFIKQLRILSTLLAKGVAHAPSPEAQATLLSSRLVSDMEGLPYQIQRISDAAKGLAVRLGGVEPVPMKDDETSFAELQARIEKTIKVLEGVTPAMMEGKENVEVVIKTSKNEWKFTGESYVLDFACPNFAFHFMIAYALLRKEGVPIGKMDYLGVA
ncbi:hypothetical protein RQP46_002574 [Phenoliferia psychrophenolica]